MSKIHRRLAMSTAFAGAAAVAVSKPVPAAAAAGDEAPEPQLWTLEGVLKVHPKFVYRYYLVLLDGQKCALYGPDHAREMDQLARLPVPSTIRVRGVLGTDHHPGSTKDNLSPFPAGWWVYMDVHEVRTVT